MPEVQVDGGAMYYETCGRGEPLVLLHGGLLSKAMWLAQVRHFADSYRVVTPDLRGHGRTGPTARRRYSVDLYVEDLRELLAAVGAEQAHVCGLSLGGIVAQAYAAAHPGRVRGLVLADTFRTVPPVGLPGVATRLLVPRAPVYAAVRTLGVRASWRLLLSAAEAAEGRRWLALRGPVREYARRELDRVTRGEFLKVLDALYEFEPVDLGTVAAPALVLFGEREAAVVRGQARRLAAALPDARRATVPDAGHIANMENPPAFNRRVGRFLARV